MVVEGGWVSIPLVSEYVVGRPMDQSLWLSLSLLGEPSTIVLEVGVDVGVVEGVELSGN